MTGQKLSTEVQTGRVVGLKGRHVKRDVEVLVDGVEVIVRVLNTRGGMESQSFLNSSAARELAYAIQHASVWAATHEKAENDRLRRAAEEDR